MSNFQLDVLATLAAEEMEKQQDSDATDDIVLTPKHYNVPDLIVDNPAFDYEIDTDSNPQVDSDDTDSLDSDDGKDAFWRDFYQNSWQYETGPSDRGDLQDLLSKMEAQGKTPKKNRQNRRRRNSDSTDSMEFIPSRRRRRLPKFPQNVLPAFQKLKNPSAPEPADFDHISSSEDFSDYSNDDKKMSETDLNLEKIANALKIGKPRKSLIMTDRRRIEIVSGLQNLLRLHDKANVEKTTTDLLPDNVVKLIKVLLDGVKQHLAQDKSGKYKSGGPSNRVGSLLSSSPSAPSVEPTPPPSQSTTPVRKGWATEAGATILIKEESTGKKKKQPPKMDITPSKRSVPTKPSSTKKSVTPNPQILNFSIPEGHNPLEVARKLARDQGRDIIFIPGTQVGLPVAPEGVFTESSDPIDPPSEDLPSDPIESEEETNLPLPQVAAAVAEVLVPLSDTLVVPRPRGIWGLHHDDRTYDSIGGSRIPEGALLCEEDLETPEGIIRVQLINSSKP